MDTKFYLEEILRYGLLPLTQSSFPDGHRFQQDNNPKHTSRRARSFMEDHGKKLVEDPAWVTGSESDWNALAWAKAFSPDQSKAYI